MVDVSENEVRTHERRATPRSAPIRGSAAATAMPSKAASANTVSVLSVTDRYFGEKTESFRGAVAFVAVTTAPQSSLLRDIAEAAPQFLPESWVVRSGRQPHRFDQRGTSRSSTQCRCHPAVHEAKRTTGQRPHRSRRSWRTSGTSRHILRWQIPESRRRCRALGRRTGCMGTRGR
jgi:hypothetical protein